MSTSKVSSSVKRKRFVKASQATIYIYRIHDEYITGKRICSGILPQKNFSIFNVRKNHI
jgi:hypothetical protein